MRRRSKPRPAHCHNLPAAHIAPSLKGRWPAAALARRQRHATCWTYWLAPPYQAVNAAPHCASTLPHGGKFMFFGSLPALVTPFSGGRVAEDTFAEFVQWQLAEASNAPVAVGRTGGVRAV